MKTILIICQARYSSTRLPGKVMLEILGKPLLWYVIRRLLLVKTPKKVIIAIGDSKNNQIIIDFAKKYNFNYFLGSENDVLDRFYQTSKYFKGDIIVRITSDCPLIDPSIIDKCLEVYLKGFYDYVCNVNPPTFPDGMDVEIFSFNALEHAWKDAEWQSEREHVTLYIRNHPEKFKIKNYENLINLKEIRLTVDEKEDFILISKMIENFHDKWDTFTMNDVIEFLYKNPNLLKINAQYERNEGLLNSLNHDKKIIF